MRRHRPIHKLSLIHRRVHHVIAREFYCPHGKPYAARFVRGGYMKSRRQACCDECEREWLGSPP